MSGETLKPKPGEIRVIDGRRLRFIEEELEGEKWEVLDPPPYEKARPTPTVEGGETQPVAWRVKDYADGWVRYGTEAEAKREAKRTGALIEPLYSADALASRDAEIERLRGELSEARAGERNMSEHVRRVAAEANDGLEALQTLDEFWDAVGYPNNRRLLTPAEQVASIYRERDAAEAERDRYLAALGEAERAINRAKEAVEDQDDIELVGSLAAALSTLKPLLEKSDG